MFQLAALSFHSANAQSDTASFALGEDGYVQALPDGAFAAVDGRPFDVQGGKWLMDAQAFAALKANTPHQAGDLVIDYEHQTLNKEKNGQPAPAAGFFNIDDLVYRQGEGLFIKPRFNDKALAHLAAQEYKYFSLVFGYDTTTGRPQYIHSGALTNRPGVDGMLPLAQLSAELSASIRIPHSSNQHHQNKHHQSKHPHQSSDKENTVNPILKQLLGKLGIEVPDNTDLTDEQATAALSALDTLVTDAAKVDGLNQQVVALSAQTAGQGSQVDLSKFVPVEVVNQMRSQLASLSAENGQLTIEQTVKTALDDGKVLACEQDYLVNLGKQQGMAALSAHLEARHPIAALTTTQTTTVTKPAEQQTQQAALSAEEIQMADSWGMSHDDFATAKEEQA